MDTAIKLRTWEELTLVEQLQSTWSDFYKEVNGFRPRWATDAQWNDAGWLQAQIDALRNETDHYFTECVKTFEGREALRAEGWVNVPAETDSELARMARWLDDERQRETADLYADADAQFYGEVV